MWFLGLLLILFLFFIVIPLLRIGIAVYRLRRRAAEMFDGQYRQQQKYYGNRQQPRPERKKKIDPGVGEYVAFEELPSEPDTGKNHDVNFTPESQIEDVGWEDIK